VNSDLVIRDQIIQLLDGGNAHLTFDDAVDRFPLGLINERPPEVTYTPWHLVEHLRIAQWDILEFIRDPDHHSPAWPLGYWPDSDSLADDSSWINTLDQFKKDLAAIKDLVQDPNIDLSAELPHAPGYTFIREFLLVADHNAYHIGEFAILRQIMGTWPAGRQM
jgi:hypothetical protein